MAHQHVFPGASSMVGPMWMPDNPPTFARLMQIHPQPVPIFPVLGLIALALYLYARHRHVREGGSWSWGSTTSWVVGIVLIEIATATGVEGYGMVLFSVHMAQHMVIGMIAPIFLVMGSPVTLALRTLPAVGRSSWMRKAIVWLIGSRLAAVVCSIPVRWFLFLSGLYGVYFTGIFDDLMHSVLGQNFLVAHFVITGYLFFGPRLAVDPWPQVNSPLMRVLEGFASVPFHAFFGVAIMTADSPMVTYFTHPPAGWGINVVSEQSTDDGIYCAVTEVPTILVIGIIVFQWYRMDQRENARAERAAARDGDAELNAYNERLAALHAHAAQQERR